MERDLEGSPELRCRHVLDGNLGAQYHLYWRFHAAPEESHNNVPLRRQWRLRGPLAAMGLGKVGTKAQLLCPVRERRAAPQGRISLHARPPDVPRQQPQAVKSLSPIQEEESEIPMPRKSNNWHDVESFYQFSCNIYGKRFEKDSVVTHKAKSHPEVLTEEALAANTSTLIISTEILGTNPESLTRPSDGQGFPFLPEPLGNSTSEGCLPLEAERMSGSYCSGMGQVSRGKSFAGNSSSEGTEGLLMNSDAITEVLIEDSDYQNLVKDKVYQTLVEGKTWGTGTAQTLYLKVKRTKKFLKHLKSREDGGCSFGGAGLRGTKREDQTEETFRALKTKLRWPLGALLYARRGPFRSEEEEEGAAAGR
ncbi:uncharacterized protein LOC108317779 [Cebus imitator]|uniref:uncharacterized protein LOC108317779 n=1 Tax=Cebus imitator TaxID=2715852 RepID=UPI001896B437|nr:uncharacterized protein LOC108317779 [Cebus imitator]